MSRPKVSVVITTYNHEKYIRQAVESVLVQRTKFRVEILIGEDNSSDKTRQIVQRYQKKYPRKIVLLLRDREELCFHGRRSGRLNFINLLNNVKGEYVALLDGDDYWCDKTKLQRQVEFLETHREFDMCFHNVREKMEGSRKERLKYKRGQLRAEYGLEDLLRNNFMPTASVVMRKRYRSLPEWFRQVPSGDWSLYVLNMGKTEAKIGYIDRVMAVYRIHGGGYWSEGNRERSVDKRIEMFRSKVKTRRYMKRVVPEQYRAVVRDELATDWYQLALLYAQKKEYLRARWCWLRGMVTKPVTGTMKVKAVASLTLRVCWPRMYERVKRRVKK